MFELFPYAGTIASIIALIYFVYYTIKVYFVRQKYQHIPGPPADGLIGFYTGNVFDLIKSYKTGKVYGDVQLEWLVYFA
jgi:hypothetical protein